MDEEHVEAVDIFASPISTVAPPALFSRTTHPLLVPSGVVRSGPVQTNNFYGNMLLSDQTQPTYTHPYVVWYSNSVNNLGLALTYSPASKMVFGPDASVNPVEYFYMPAGIGSFVMGASDFDSSVAFGMKNISKFGSTLTFTATDGGYMIAPVVQGMGFVTTVYYNLIPRINSMVGFTSITGASAPKAGIQKYQITLNDASVWWMYVTIPLGQSLQFRLNGGSQIISSNSVSGCVIQLCTGVNGAYDGAAGCYATDASISATVSGSTATYSLNYSVSGTSNTNTTMLFALPHHVESFVSSMAASKTSISLQTPSKGIATGYLTNTFTMTELLPTTIGFAPWTSITANPAGYSTAALAAIQAAAASEANDDVASLSNVDSMYVSGKILDKYAYVLWVVMYLLEDRTTAAMLLAKMKTAIERFSNNTQQTPLVYDITWGGIRSGSNDSTADYGNPYYNDHHFHYGYHIHAAAIVAKVDMDLGGTWLIQVSPWVQSLVRDVANPSSLDTYFPVFRSFDFFHGHSWAHGLFAAADGKDQESSSEDYNFSYAMKIWATVTGDTNMEARANLMLAIQKRAMNLYYLLADSNTVQPANFIQNKVAGILFENKLDHTTYFGTNLEYIQGIHMLPITPVSSFIRGPTFVQQEWDEKLASIVGGLTSGWRGILMLNSALFDPQLGFQFFNGSSYNSEYLDNGMSLTWSLVYTAGVGGST
ncbi:glycoside hydrolase family 81 protein [Babjeviella inositovora NRRL Y-12698]|uniref:glucan endo-1,3-beta-D-glucosidase n=1 Tax=Babjeviella inositovora NRRL Y-12698 TaxID=984486 RepID=A0A1E3QRR7_9ASCO|nr:glycoside hydrolase family 81 protein [Babjeviella inositovora NRRL Y-12698]ODQ80184.1 glycoside hydrolase family 81 protein [Babjeviella inositovora NRRL Y-12698]